MPRVELFLIVCMVALGCAEPAPLRGPELVDNEGTSGAELSRPAPGELGAEEMTEPRALEDAPRAEIRNIEDTPRIEPRADGQERITQLPDHPTRLDARERARVTQADACPAADLRCRAGALQGATSAGGHLQLIEALRGSGNESDARREVERFIESHGGHSAAQELLQQFDMLNAAAR